MIDEKKLIEEIRKRRDYWESKAAEYDEAGERYEYLMDVCDGKATELTATLSIINEQPKVAEWIPCWERLPENAKHKGAFCPKHHVKTKYGILAALRNDVSDWLVHHQGNWTARDWDKLYEAVVREQEKRKKTNGRNNTKGNNSPAL